ncbi:MAG: ABC transporter permease subunit [Candidatus Leucobacter sulfamidivorax]|nr:ABC transporter permease subunit [Candidatus Leucobacter sulfamidivorax]
MTTATPAQRAVRGPFSDRLLGVGGILAFLLLLELIPRSGVVDPAYFPPLSSMLAGLFAQFGQAAFWSAFGSTLLGWFLGLLIAVLLALVLGIVIGSLPLVREFSESTIEFLRPIPSVALIPIAVILFGNQMQSTLILVVYAAFWQMLVQVIAGVQDVDPVAHDTARSFRFSARTRVFRIILPSALPFMMTGFRLAAAIALILELTGEFIMGSPGIGKIVAVAYSSGDTATMYGLVLLTGVLGVLVNVGTRLVDRLLLSWHPSVRLEIAA